MSDVNVPTRVPTGVATSPGGSMIVGADPREGAAEPAPGVAAVQSAGAGPLVEVTCPGCGALAHVRADRRSAADFCATCDHPLFWAGVRSAPEGVADDASLDARYRAPGVVGTAQHSPLACPRCGEHNHATWGACVRCGAELDPPPPPPPVPPAPAPAPPQVVTVERPVPCGHPPVWLVVLISSIISAAVVAGIFLAVG